MSIGQKIHLPGLNGIRTLASIIVLVFHIDQFMNFFGLKSIGFHKTGTAGYGVKLFFVLSGYLISYLLLIEKENFGTIDLPKFYVRRILRIWPIYYLVIFFTLILYLVWPNLNIFPKENILETFLLYSFLMSNVGYGLGMGITTKTPLWSVGVEEQFYMFWPLIISKTRNFVFSLFTVIFIYLLIKLLFRIFENGPIYKLIGICCFDCMAIGGLGAYLVFTKSKYLKLFYNQLAQIISWGVLLVSVFYKPIHIFSILDVEFNSIFYLILILNVSSNKKTLITLENYFFNFIGKISYGIYVYHLFVYFVLSLFFKHILKIQLVESIYSYLLVFSTTISATIFVAYISNKYFESYFLKQKSKFSKVYSTN